MRKIEQQMNQAIARGINWAGGNTQVITHDSGMSEVFLHGHRIASCFGLDSKCRPSLVDVDKATLIDWPTRTTMSRLRALGVNVCTRKGDVVLNGEVIS